MNAFELRNRQTMYTVLDAIVAAALSFLTGSSAPAAVGLAVSCGGRRMGSADLQMLVFSERSRLVCSHRPRPRPAASKPDRSDGPRWAPQVIDGRQSDSQARACIGHHVHLSLRHRGRRAFVPRRFVSARSSPVHAWWAAGRGIVDRAGDGGRPNAPCPRIMSLAVQASLQLSGWSLR